MSIRKLVTNQLKNFQFDFHVIVQSFEVQVDGLKAFDKSTLEWQRIFGSVMTADVEDVESIEKILTAKQGDKQLPIRWEIDASRNKFLFIVDSVVRGDLASIVILEWNGKPINIEYKGSKEINVPALGDFIVVDKKVFVVPASFRSEPLNIDALNSPECSRGSTKLRR